jgi:hypothetical protein
MEEQELKDFSWTAFLLVTGFSFILFSKTLQFLDGARMPVLTLIGIVAIVAGSLFGIMTVKEKSESN